MSEKEMIGVRIDSELSAWLKEKATSNNCKVSDLIREAILVFKQAETISEDMRFSDLINTKGAKAALMSYRLLEKFVQQISDNGKQIVLAASEQSMQDFAKWKVESCKLQQEEISIS